MYHSKPTHTWSHALTSNKISSPSQNQILTRPNLGSIIKLQLAAGPAVGGRVPGGEWQLAGGGS